MRVRSVVTFVTILFVSTSLFAQGMPGIITGVVRDSSSAAIPGVVVHATNLATGAAFDAVTDEQGSYQIGALVPGRYRLETKLDGFETDDREVLVEAGTTIRISVTLEPAHLTEGVIVTARRIEESAQDVPIPLSVVGGTVVSEAGAFNVNRLQEIVPTVQFYSTNPRNSAINVRGLGAPFGLTNDGLEQGVGMYIDGVYYARPAAATLDFIDVDRIEVLRGPQGTLFGKNTTAGAINITTRKPTFKPESDLEINYGNIGFVQAKASVSGPLTQKVAGRLSFSGTQRNGTVRNIKTRGLQNNMNNLGLRGQVMFAPSDALAITATVDHTRQRPQGFTQVVAGVAPTLRPANRQFAQIAADLGYAPPSFNAFDRVTDIDTPLRSNQDLGGSALAIDWKVGPGRLNTTTAWRYWNWDPSNDRDFIGLPVTSISAAPSKQRQWTEEVRYAGAVSPRLNFVVGVFAFRQTINSDPSFKQEQGSAAARFLLAPSAAAATPGLLDGFGFNQYVQYGNTSAAVFSQVTLSVTNRLRLLPGIRFNYDQKNVDFDQQIYGGLKTSDPALIALRQSILAPQAYKTDVSANNTSAQLTAAYQLTGAVNAYASYATAFKSVGLNLNGVPTDSANQPVLSAATVKPEDVHNVEFGVKTTPWRGVTGNVSGYDTEIKNFQAQVMNAGVGVLRGYLANARKVRVRGMEFDANVRLSRDVSFYGSGAYTDGRYISFPDAPPPLEDTGGPSSKDISGSLLPGISKWAFSSGGEYDIPASLLGRGGQYFVGIDGAYRSSFSSSPTYSRYLVVPGYPLVNARIGFRAASGWTLSVWSRNLLNKDYYELLTAAPGNTGLYVGQPGDARTAGVTLRIALKAR
jgi:iron complex outermembrane receptor protein